MSKFQQKAEAQTKQIIGQMLGDELLVEEGKKQQREATEPGAVTMTRAAMTKARRRARSFRAVRRAHQIQK